MSFTVSLSTVSKQTLFLSIDPLNDLIDYKEFLHFEQQQQLNVEVARTQHTECQVQGHWEVLLFLSRSLSFAYNRYA